jgi:hypothetical protein
MALDSDAVTLATRGYFFINDTVGAEPPADTIAELDALDLTAATLATGWRNIGHTSRETNATFARDGGDVTTLGSWQADALFTSTAPVTQTVTFSALQTSNDVLLAFYGGGDITDEDVFVLPDSPVPLEKALWLAIESGSQREARWWGKVSLSAADSQEVGPESLVEYALTATVLKGTSIDLGRIYRTGIGTPA